MEGSLMSFVDVRLGIKSARLALESEKKAKSFWNFEAKNSL